jgi:threonyl-tRNA synthetase
MFNHFRQVSSNDYPVIENRVKQIVKDKQPFERLVMTKENLLKMFEVNKQWLYVTKLLKNEVLTIIEKYVNTF